jgi:hypothetical protein
MASLDDVITVGNSLNKNISQLIVRMQSDTVSLVSAINGVTVKATGTFTLGAAVTTTVTQTATAANSIILLMPTNAAAGTLMGSAKALYVSARTAGASFAVSTASGVAAAGTETFSYCLFNPS